MKLGMKQLGGILGAAALTVGGLGLLQASGCEEAAKQCGFTCEGPDGKVHGIAEGNFAISGNAGIDGFFKSVVNFKGVASGVSADIRAELDGIGLAFGLTPAELKGDIGAAIAAKLDADFNASLVVDAQPAKCEVDASFTATATAECQASAGCDVDPGKAEVSCMGKCTVEVEAAAECDAEATVKCELSGPSVACEGECSGSCTATANLEVAASCSGTCVGSCDAECAGDTDNGAGCNGQCMGNCQGECKTTVSGEAALDCKGTCNGSCKATAPEAGCDASAKVSCEASGSAEASCKGSCEGEFIPPKADCEASASCEASAKADANFSAKCTPPSIDVKLTVEGSLNADAQARLDFAVGELKVRLPRLLASMKKADLVLKAGEGLVGDGKAAIEATIDAFAEGDVDVGLAYKLGSCVPAQLEASGEAISGATASLSEQFSAAGKLTAGLGM